MDQAQYWMWMKRREILKSHFQASMTTFTDSWEEKAFAEDAAGPLGGCMWPPRSYSCSFCKREFRSAQALGGHMNVHRRDRARLKQSLIPHNDQVLHQNQNQYPMKSFKSHFPSEVCTLDYHILDPNSGSSTVASTTLSPSRVSALSTQENLSEHTFVSPCSYSIVQELHKVSPFAVSSSRPEVEENPREEDSTSHDDYVETNLSMGMNLVVNRNRPTGSCGDEVISCKRPKTAISTLPFFPSNDNYPLQFEALGFKPSSMEDLDLELKLGDPPKVK